MINTVNKNRNKGKIEGMFWRPMSMAVKENKLPNQYLILIRELNINITNFCSMFYNYEILWTL